MIPDIEFQENLEKLYDRNQLVPRVKSAFSGEGFRNLLNQKGIPEDFGISLLAHMAIHKQANIQTMVGLLRHHFEQEYENAASQACADYISECVIKDILDWHIDKRVLIARFLVSPDIQREIDLYQFPLPMVIPPRMVNHNRETGYVTIRESLILGGQYHEHDICLDHLNRMNSVPLKLNENTMRKTKNNWKNIGVRKSGETAEDYEARHKAFYKYNHDSMEVMENIIFTGNRFWLTNRVDKRGRTYSVGYHVNPQGTEYNKAVIEFDEGEIVTQTP